MCTSIRRAVVRRTYLGRTGAAGFFILFIYLFFFFKSTLDTRTSNEVFVGGAHYRQGLARLCARIAADALRAAINHYRLSTHTHTHTFYVTITF